MDNSARLMQIWTLTDISSWFPILHYMNFADSAICANNCVLIKAEDTGKLTRILSYNTHTHTLICLKLLHITFECTESRLTWDVCSSPHSPPQNVGSRGATWGPSHIGGERKKKTKTCCCSWKQTALHCCREQPRRWCLETLSNRSTIICTLPVQRAANVIAESREV